MRLLFAFGLAFVLHSGSVFSQTVLFGADLSYTNEMEDCGVVYKVKDQPKDPFKIFSEHGCNLVRLRLWHNPAWYDTLNTGKRYSDLQDVRNSMARAKANGMKVLLDFHLSDTWADPKRQLVPVAWEGVVDNLPLLKDSVYNYIAQTLLNLDRSGLMPELVQIGNETNRGILLSPAMDSAGWILDWDRNSQLFNRAIEAVRDVEKSTGKSIKVALHIAGPADAWWLMEGFWNHGVRDFDIIGLSYYWAWHQPTSIEDAGNVVTELRRDYPGKEVMIFETGYIWTNKWNDNASNIITAVHPDYAPASPENQRKWLIDMSQEVISKGATGVIYWEPAWQSSPCRTPWGQGSHQEHATYFDFQNNLLQGGGMDFMTHNYEPVKTTREKLPFASFKVHPDEGRHGLQLKLEGFSSDKFLQVNLLDHSGKKVASQLFSSVKGSQLNFPIPVLPSGLYYVAIYEQGVCRATRGVALGK